MLVHATAMLDTVPHLSQLLDATFPGRRLADFSALPAQLSTRRYFRLGLLGSPASVIAMRLPDDEPPDGPARVQARAFVDVQRFLSSRDIPVPQIYAEDIAHGLVLLEDLGDETFEARLRTMPTAEWHRPYAQAIDLLAKLHQTAESSAADECIALRRRFEASLLRSELDHFREWGLEALHGPLNGADRAQLDGYFDRLVESIVALPTGLVHRDFQSRNLMWAPSGALVTIDFQDAFIGPAAYDLVALLCDSYVELDAGLQDAMLLRYAERRDYTAAQLTQLVHGFRLIAVQRKLKDAGRFVFIERVRKNPSFLGYYPGSLRYVARAIAELPELSPLRQALLRLVPGFPS
jgi:aminoglycoside/choline kinase family phosphotransferase